MSRASWSKHRHWHDGRGKTHKQGEEVLTLPVAPRPGYPTRVDRCWQCRHGYDHETNLACPECGADAIPF